MEQPLVSVRLQTYNHAAFIKDAIESILMQQTTFPFEVVIGDDFSSDGTTEICMEYASKYPNRIKLLQRARGDAYDLERQKKGRLYNFANTVANCTGKYVALLDGDDVWGDPEKLQKQVAFLRRTLILFSVIMMLRSLMSTIKLQKQASYSMRISGTFKSLNYKRVPFYSPPPSVSEM